MQACSDLAHVVLVLVNVRRVTVVIVHIGLHEVVVVVYFCAAIFVRELLYQEVFSLRFIHLILLIFLISLTSSSSLL